MSFTARAFGGLFLLLAAVAPATAQNYAGQWRCEMANQTVTNNAFENWTYSFALALYANGSFEAQGQYYAQTNGFNMPFRAQGSWQAVQGGLVAQGQEQRQGYNGPFFLALTYYGPGNMAYRTSGTAGNLAMACRQ
jgi:hypothetical protein